MEAGFVLEEVGGGRVLFLLEKFSCQVWRWLSSLSIESRVSGVVNKERLLTVYTIIPHTRTYTNYNTRCVCVFCCEHGSMEVWKKLGYNRTGTSKSYSQMGDAPEKISVSTTYKIIQHAIYLHPSLFLCSVY